MVSRMDSGEPGAMPTARPALELTRTATVVLVGCVKRKRTGVHPASDLYSSALWRARRGYAEEAGGPWFILSALHGLVDPDEPLAPYDFALADVSRAERRVWAERVVAGLEQRLGPVAGIAFELHAGGAYRGVLEPALVRRGATVQSPTAAIRGVGNQIAWYARPAGMLVSSAALETRSGASAVGAAGPAVASRRRLATAAEIEAALVALDRAPVIVRALGWPVGVGGLDRPGLYSWWVDARGAEMLTRGIGHRVAVGRIYAGLTGATKWPSGKTGRNTLRSRIRGHIGGNLGGSTFRHTLASVLTDQLGLMPVGPKSMPRISEEALKTWIRAHLSVAVHPVVDPDPLADLERRVLARLDPPLNLEDMRLTPARARLKELRQALGRGV
jgi:hypothetical protein